MSLSVTTSNNVQIYNVSGEEHHRLPSMLTTSSSERKKLSKQDASFANRVQIIQDFGFSEASSLVRFTPDHQHVIATGTYKPQVRVYDLTECALKFERHTVSEIVALSILEQDWRKLALLRSDRTLELHAAGGMHHSVRLPRFGRDLAFDERTAQLLVCGSSNEMQRFSLDRGQFLQPLELSVENANAIEISPLHGLVGVAIDSGTVEFWDLRVRRRLGGVALESLQTTPLGSAADATSLQFLPDGMHWAVGTSTGTVALFDIRNNQRPLFTGEHRNDRAVRRIRHVKMHGTEQRLLASMDAKGIKFWDLDASEMGRMFTCIEDEADLCDFDVQQDTGLVVAAVEAPMMRAYFVPAIGPAPKWCRYLENITEEMEEKSLHSKQSSSSAISYENYRFVTREDLAAVGLDHLLGTRMLKPYMHGFFVDVRLYEKARAIAQPFAYEEYVSKVRDSKLEQARASRISVRNDTVKVNQELREKLQAMAQEDLSDDDDESKNAVMAAEKELKKKKRNRDAAKAILADDRFASIFQDDDFAMDEEELVQS